MSGHTPGPWTHTEDGEIIAAEGARYIVAEAFDGFPDGQYQANCRLIAAAPELLEALDRMVRWGRAQKTAEGSGFYSLEQACAAIAKARGEQ